MNRLVRDRWFDEEARDQFGKPTDPVVPRHVTDVDDTHTPLTAAEMEALREWALHGSGLMRHRTRVARLLDMVDGYQQREEGWKQLVRVMDLGMPGDSYWTPERLTECGHPDLAVVLDLALTPQGDEEA